MAHWNKTRGSYVGFGYPVSNRILRESDTCTECDSEALVHHALSQQPLANFRVHKLPIQDGRPICADVASWRKLPGGAVGIGKEMALLFAKYGAKIVIGDVNLEEAQKVVQTINESGQNAVACLCDVTKWDDQVSLFELANTTFGSVDIVIPNAGVIGAGQFTKLEVKDGKPLPPNLLAINVNLIGVLYTTSLALHYMGGENTQRLRAIVLIGSIASFVATSPGVLYDTAKHGVLGVMRGLRPTCAVRGVRLGSVHPWFADTPLLNAAVRSYIEGWPLTPVGRIAATALCVASHADETTSGHPWILPDDGDAVRYDGADLNEGFYKELNERAQLVAKMWNAESGQRHN
ncbi:hypothetical protein NM688_g1972 [Phlebia brevispora]|uniref:Uncharacterized protein n=1 Tax=Phlebia brevispora TaxID=194682 RepID=A0ACC1TA31_9APHY|nr:hypothetical protein NM688_g1972 [Phlebia brevispora]